jgi:1,2-dihydroxy-3-keto-5-methylthiopentene dioxygenase
MKVYYHDNVDSDQRLPHEGEPVTPADLEALGVFAANIPDQAEVDKIAEERGYRNRDEVSDTPSPNMTTARLLKRVAGFETETNWVKVKISPELQGEKYPSMIKMFYEEHLHVDEEIRYILGGEGYFDVFTLPLPPGAFLQPKPGPCRANPLKFFPGLW